MNSKIEEAFNAHLNNELYSSYLYLSMAAFFENKNLDGMAGWMRIQSDEEQQHAMRFLDFINQRGGRVRLESIEGPPTDWETPLKAFQEAYEHEQQVTGRINELVALSIDERDFSSNAFLQWFVNEQVEEEATINSIVEKLTMVSDQAAALFMIDQELGRRPALAGPAPAP